MKKRFPLLLLAFWVASACLSPAADTPQATVTPTITAPSTLPPTLTPIPTPTVHPQFIAVRERFAQSETFTLNQNGEIEMQTPDGMTIVPDIQVQPDGTMTFTHDGQEFQADPNTLTIESQTITFKDTEGKTWVFDGENWEDKTAEVKLAEDMEIFKLSLDDYKITYDAEGKIELRDKSNKLVYWDGKWDSAEAQKIAVRDCLPTDFTPTAGTNTVTGTLRDKFHEEVVDPLLSLFLKSPYFDINLYSSRAIKRVNVPLRNTDNCWAFFLGSAEEIHHLAWLRKNSELAAVKVFGIKVP
jgi:hypothetical protein